MLLEYTLASSRNISYKKAIEEVVYQCTQIEANKRIHGWDVNTLEDIDLGQRAAEVLQDALDRCARIHYL